MAPPFIIIQATKLTPMGATQGSTPSRASVVATSGSGTSLLCQQQGSSKLDSTVKRKMLGQPSSFQSQKVCSPSASQQGVQIAFIGPKTQSSGVPGMSITLCTGLRV